MSPSPCLLLAAIASAAVLQATASYAPGMAGPAKGNTGFVGKATDCFNKTLASWQWNHHRISVGKPVVSLTVNVEHYDHNHLCIKNSGFGFSGSEVWVDKGCRAQFTLCLGNKPVRPTITADKSTWVKQDTVVLTCETATNDVTAYEFYRNDVIVQATQNHELKLGPSSRGADAKNYSCVAKTKVASDRSDGILVGSRGGHFTDNTGVITSPNYPGNYPNSTDYTWQIEVPSPARIRFNFGMLRMEVSENCKYDSLEISAPGMDTQTLCHKGTVKDLETPGSTATIKFKTDSTVVDQGFSITYTAFTDGKEKKEEAPIDRRNRQRVIQPNP